MNNPISTTQLNALLAMNSSKAFFESVNTVSLNTDDVKKQPLAIYAENLSMFGGNVLPENIQTIQRITSRIAYFGKGISDLGTLCINDEAIMFQDRLDVSMSSFMFDLGQHMSEELRETIITYLTSLNTKKAQN